MKRIDLASTLALASLGVGASSEATFLNDKPVSLKKAIPGKPLGEGGRMLFADSRGVRYFRDDKGTIRRAPVVGGDSRK